MDLSYVYVRVALTAPLKSAVRQIDRGSDPSFLIMHNLPSKVIKIFPLVGEPSSPVSSQLLIQLSVPSFLLYERVLKLSATVCSGRRLQFNSNW